MDEGRVSREVCWRYASVRVVGTRITRLEERNLGCFKLDCKAAIRLGTENLGVFVGRCSALDKIVGVLRSLYCVDDEGRWLLVAATKKIAAVIVQRWFGDGKVDRVNPSKLRLPISYGNIVLGTPESLGQIDEDSRRRIALVVVIDPYCYLHKLRGVGGQHQGISWDRPQLVAKFRNEVAIEGWIPPMALLTYTPAKAVETEMIGQAYCLDAWWFLDGQTLRCSARSFAGDQDFEDAMLR
jgi:hypothetical protein